MKTLILLSIVFLAGCGAEQRFMAIGVPSQHPAIQMKEVLVFTNPSQIPWPYTEIGEISPSKQPLRFQTTAVQIDDIKREAAKQGAEAIILHKETTQASGFYMDNGTAYGSGYAVMQYSATAIVRKANQP